MSLWPFKLLLGADSRTFPSFNPSRDWSSGNVGIFSRLLGLDASFRKKIIQLFDLAYASRLRLIYIISGCFVLCHICISYVPTVEIIVEAEEEEDDSVSDVSFGDEEEEDTEEET